MLCVVLLWITAWRFCVLFVLLPQIRLCSCVCACENVHLLGALSLVFATFEDCDEATAFALFASAIILSICCSISAALRSGLQQQKCKCYETKQITVEVALIVQQQSVGAQGAEWVAAVAAGSA